MVVYATSLTFIRAKHASRRGYEVGSKIEEPEQFDVLVNVLCTKSFKP